MTSGYGDRLRAFNEAGVRYLVVGAHAFIEHAEPRLTKDLEVWVEPTARNAARVWDALAALYRSASALKSSRRGVRLTVSIVPPVLGAPE